MKKIIIIFLLLLLMMPIAYAAADTLLYSLAGTGGSQAWGDNTASQYSGSYVNMSFLGTKVVSNISILAKKTGAYAGNYWLRFYTSGNTSNGFADGTAATLKGGSIGNNSGASLTGSYLWYNISVNNLTFPITGGNDRNYTFVLMSTTFDNGNYGVFETTAQTSTSGRNTTTGAAPTALTTYYTTRVMSIMIWGHDAPVINKSVSTTPTLSAISPTTGIGNFSTSVTNYGSNIATIYYNWFINDSTTALLKNTTNSSGSWMNCSLYPSCKPSSMIYVRARATNGTAKSSYSAGVTYSIAAPVLALRTTNSFTALNYSIINQFKQENFTLAFNLTDNTELYALQINISKGNSKPYNLSWTNLTGRIEFNFTRNLNISNWTTGNYTIKTLLSDTHTAAKIDSYEPIATPNRLLFKTAENNNIGIEAIGAVDTNTIKQYDRYNFQFDYNKENNPVTKDFYLTSDNPITYLPNSKYKGHFVIWNGFSGNWVDFEGEEGKLSVTRISDYRYKVSLTTLNEALTFNSIGGLNVVTKYYQWYKGNYNKTNLASLKLLAASIILNITKDNSINNIGADIFYNGTQHTPTKISGINSDLFTYSFTAANTAGTYAYYWNTSVTQGDLSVYKFNITGTHIVNSYGLSLCSTGNKTVAVNIYDEDNPTLRLNGTAEIEASFWFPSSSTILNYTNNVTHQGKFYLCISPNTTTVLRGNLYIKYTVPTGYTHRYYLFNSTFSTTIQNLSLYNLNTTTGISLLRATTRQPFTYNFYKNILGKLQRRYVAEGVWRTVQMDLSGDYGLQLYDIYEKVVDYRFIFTDTNNNVLRTTNNLVFSCDTAICDLTFIVSPTGSTTTTEDVTVIGSWNNATKILTINWTDNLAAVADVRTIVQKQTMTGILTICESNQTGAAGSYTCNLSSQSGTVEVIVTGNNIIKLNTMLNLKGLRLGNFIGNMEGALWTGLIVVVIAFTALISPVAIVISTVLGLIVILLLGIFTPISAVAVISGAILAGIIGYKLGRF